MPIVVTLDEMLVRRKVKSRDLVRLIESRLSHQQRQALERNAPTHLEVPSGSRVVVQYPPVDWKDQQPLPSPIVAIRLQELFGLAETPGIGPRREPVVFELLAPNGRPVQTTRDLRSFWERTYPEVRKELRGRYPNCATAAALRALRQPGSSDAEAREKVVRLLQQKEAALARLRQHLRIRALLEIWLYVHVPLTFALIAALSAHIISVFFYW